MANLAVAGADQSEVASIFKMATESLPRDLFVVERQNVVVGARNRRPSWSSDGDRTRHGSQGTALCARGRSGESRASARMRCRRQGRHVGIRGA
jgi:hypothetical protein